MDADVFRVLFLALFAANVGAEAVLGALNRREALRHAGPPADLEGHFDADVFSRSRGYALDRLALDRVALAYTTLLTLALLFSGILPFADRMLAGTLGPGPLQGTVFLSAVLLAQAILKFPLSLYATFRVEGNHGFNTMTWGLYLKDAAKGLALTLVLGVPVLYALLWIMDRAGARWWLWAFALVLGFQVLLTVGYPHLIAPLFNRFRPMEEGPVKQALLELAAALRFPARDLYVMDGSRRSLHANAYFTGFGRFRRIVLYDTLLNQMDAAELKSVLAHEIGHYKLGHIYTNLLVQASMLLALLYLLSLSLAWPPLYQAFAFDQSAAGHRPAVGLFLFFTVFSCLGILLAPLGNFLSRRHEFEADAFAVKALGGSEAMRSALIRLSRKNLSNLTPHPWYGAFHHSHPALRERLSALRVEGDKPIGRMQGNG